MLPMIFPVMYILGSVNNLIHKYAPAKMIKANMIITVTVIVEPSNTPERNSAFVHCVDLGNIVALCTESKIYADSFKIYGIEVIVARTFL